MRTYPVSLAFFLATAVVMILQATPTVGIFLMFMLAMSWSVLLINAGMIGVALEALFARVSRWWLILPVAFYGGYLSLAVADHLTLRLLSSGYEAANAKVTVPFDPNQQALVFDGKENSGRWFVQNYRLPVTYSPSRNSPEGFQSTRLIASEICSEIREIRALHAAGIDTLGFHDGDALRSQRLETRFCTLDMPERPTLPLVTVTRREDSFNQGSLPVTRATITITTPAGGRFRLLGGVAAPLPWIPMPIMGCQLNSGAAKWQCHAGFSRSGFTPIVAGKIRYNRDSLTLANALGLKRVAPADRVSSDVTLLRAKIAAFEEATITEQLSAVDQMIADPTARVKDWQTGVIVNRPEVLVDKADAIMASLEKAAAVSAVNGSRAAESGRILARLIASLPHDRFVSYGPRLLILYRVNFRSEKDGNVSQSHWLWDAESLLRKLGDLGPAAIFVAVDPRASGPNVNGAGIEAMCRIGAPGRAETAPVLLEKWRKLDPVDREERRALFVAMRRIGIVPPPIVESAAARARRERANSAFGGVMKQRESPWNELNKEWSEVTPASPPRVCSPTEAQASSRK